MSAGSKSYIMWVVMLVLIGSILGALTRIEINNWYSVLNRSSFTPPNYVFPIIWTVLYIMIATCGWIIWRQPSFPKLRLIKILYVIQLILNWSWAPLFFRYHLTGVSLECVLVMDITVALIIYFSYTRIRSVSLLMMPYLIWILFATYLNFYIWQYN